MVSVNTMIEQLSGLLGTGDLTDWEHSFIEDNYARYKERKNTSVFSAKQLEVVERIWAKHFA